MSRRLHSISALSLLGLSLPYFTVPQANGGGKPLVQITAVTVNGASSQAQLTVRQGPIDLADLSLTDLEGTPSVLSPSPHPLQTGAVVDVIWEKAADIQGAIRITGHTLAATDDQLEILLKGVPVDAVEWSNRDGSIAKTEAGDFTTLVSQHQWIGADQTSAVELPPSKHIHRKGPTDTDTAADWEDGGDLPVTAGGKAGTKNTGSSTELPSSGAGDLILLCWAGALLLGGAYELLRPGR